MQTLTPPADNPAVPLPRRCPPLVLTPPERARYQADLAEQAALRRLPPAA
jgi:hypothetical protein